MPKRHRMLLVLAALCACWPAAAGAQQPFATDDADVTGRGKFHFELSNQFDLLQPEAFPNLRQNTASFELAYGLFDNVEVSVEAPLIALFNARGTSPRSAFGVGDANVSVKYNFLRERAGSRRPALAATLGVELPTGDAGRQLGSGVADFTLNGIMQKTPTERTTWRLNGGVVFSGNTLTGALGVGARGVVYTGGTSLVRKLTPRLDLGAEVTGAYARNAQLGKVGLQAQAGGNYLLREGLTLDFGVVAGRFVGSPRLGAQFGFSYDF